VTLNSKPTLEVWDSCCIIGILNGEKDKLPALLADRQRFEAGVALLGIPSAAATEIVFLSDGTAADEKVREFLSNPYVQYLMPSQEVASRSSKLQFRFNEKQTPDFKDRAIAAGVPKDQAHRLKSKDSEILATALVYKATRLTTYDPLLLFIGAEYITSETGLVIAKPSASMLQFEGEGASLD
jgi:hypothetical protein